MAYETVKSVVKAMKILELLTGQRLEQKPLTLSRIAKDTGILPVTARNLLRTLEECGYAKRVGHGRYREGKQCYRLFHNEGVLRRLRDTAEPIVKQSVEDIGESVLLVTLFDNRRIELLRCLSKDDNQLNPQWQANADYYLMRTTRTFLAWLSQSELQNFVDKNRLPTIEEWPECKGNFEKLAKELKKIRRAGGCIDIHSDFYAIAVPVLSASDEIVASLGCYARVERTDIARAAGIKSLLHQAAETIQQQMGQ